MSRTHRISAKYACVLITCIGIYLQDSIFAQVCFYDSNEKELSKFEVNSVSNTDSIQSYFLDSGINKVHRIHVNGIEDITNLLSAALKEGGLIQISGDIGVVSRPLVISQDNTHIIVDRNTIIKWTHPTYGVILRTIYTVDKTTILNNISVVGGIWEIGGADIDPGGAPAIMMVGVSNLLVSNIIMYDPYKFFFGFGGIDGFEISNITMILRNTSIPGKDGLHFAGGVRNGIVSNIRGNTTDDLVALNFGGDVVGDSEKGMMFVGDSYNVRVTNVFSDNAWQAVRLLADDIYKCTDIVIDGVYGVVKNHSCISISGWMFEGHSAKFGDITLSNIHIRTPNTIRDSYEAWHTPIVLVGNHWSGIVPCTINRLTIKQCVVTQSPGMIQTPVRILGNTIIDSLVIDELIVQSDGIVDLGERNVVDIGFGDTNTTVENLKITNSYIEKTSTPFRSLISLENDVSKVGKTIIDNNLLGTTLPNSLGNMTVTNNRFL